MGGVDALGREEEGAQLASVHAAALAGMDLGAAHVLGRVGGDRSVDVGDAVVATNRREATVDRRGGQAPLLEGRAVELDLGAGRLEDGQAQVGGPLEEGEQVVAISVEGPAAVAGQEGDGSKLGFMSRSARKPWIVTVLVASVGMSGLPS